MLLENHCLKDDKEKEEPLRASDSSARASSPPSLGGSMSLEAAAAVPLFLFFFFFFFLVRKWYRQRGRRREHGDRGGRFSCRFGDFCEKQSDRLPRRCFLAAFLCCRRTGRTVLCRIEDHDGRGPRRDRGQLQDPAVYQDHSLPGFHDAGEILRPCLGGMDAGKRPS